MREFTRSLTQAGERRDSGSKPSTLGSRSVIAGSSDDQGGAKCHRQARNVDVHGDDAFHPIVCDGQLAALAGVDRCYFLTDDLTDEQLRLAAAMCLCSREVRAGRLDGPFTTELAERWADVFLSLDP